MGFDVREYRQHFPMLTQKVNGHPLVYFDNAASSLKPISVADRIHKYYTSETSNIHRGAHFFSRKGTEEYEAVRRKVQSFIGAATPEEIIFTRGTTEAINLVMYAYAERNLKKDDIILLSPFEHHSNIVPWKLLSERYGCKIEVLPFALDGKIQKQSLASYDGRPVKIVSLMLYSNVTGVRLDVESVLSWAKEKKCVTLVDAAQAMLTETINVQKNGL